MDPIAASLEPIRGIAVPAVYVIAVGALITELAVLTFLGKKTDRKGGLISIASGIMAFGFLALANRLFFIGVLEWMWQHRLADFGIGPLAWVGCFFLQDFLFYVNHRLSHEIRFLWCFHQVHHSTDEMRLASAVRGSAFDFVTNVWIFVWIPLIGLHPHLFLIVESVNRIWGILQHVSPHLVGKWGVLDRWFITPSVHRVHHGKNFAYLDRNYGEILLLWDRLFGTWEPEHEEPEYGILKEINLHSLAAVQLSPWADLWHDLKRAPDWTSRFRYLFDAPGWSHDGEEKRVRVLRRAGSVGHPSATGTAG